MSDLFTPAMDGFLDDGLGRGGSDAVDDSIPTEISGVVSDLDGEPDPDDAKIEDV